jgi:hypothetical protein
LHRAAEPLRDRFPQYLRPRPEAGQSRRQQSREAAPRYLPHEYRGEEPGRCHPQGRQTPRPLPCLRQRPRHPGGDHIDWKSIVKALKEVGYEGDVVIESFTTDVKVIARAAAIWRKIEPKRDNIAVDGLANLKKLFGKKR